MAADIFISFASKDVKVALTLCQAIESRGFKCWISARDIQPGDNFQISIVQAIRRAKILLLVFTANSNTSEEMTKELALASQQKMIVIPLRVEDVTPNDAFAYEFATRQWIDAFADWEFSIEQLCRRIGYALAGGEEADPGALSKVAPRAAEDFEPEPEAAPPLKPEAVKPGKAGPVRAAKPEPAPAPPKAKPAPKPVEAVNDAGDDEAPRASGARRLMVAGLIIAVMAGAGITATMLLRPKNEAVAAAPPAAQAVAIAPVDVAAVAAPVEEVVEAEPEPVVEAAPKPKPRRRQATQQATTGPVDIPY